MGNVASGIEVLVRERLEVIRGQRLGLIVNDGAIDRGFRHVIDLVQTVPGARIVRLFAAEHGVRGEAEAGAPIDDGVDALTGLLIQSIYGPRLWPTDEALADLDCLVFDLPDAGARFYTRPATMVYCLRAAARNGKRFVVLDRPNPLAGEAIEGPILLPEFESFVGLPGLPIRHGLTMGELAALFAADERLGVDLSVVPAAGWRRSQWFDETGLPWIMPSPNLPTLESATVYPGTCLIEGTTLSEGRGTTRSFELIGAPFVAPDRLAAVLNTQSLPGVHFRPTYFRPVASKHQDRLCGGVQLHVVDRSAFRPVLSGVALLLTLQRLWPEEFGWCPAPANGIAHAERLAGGIWLREAVQARASAWEVAAGWTTDEREFAERRAPHLLY
jgi:uncharacterized protein YbbC (DUF1343 family)